MAILSLQQVLAVILPSLQQVMVVVVTVMDLFIANAITKLAGVSESYHMYLAFINMVVNCVIHVMIARVNFSDVNNIKLAYVLCILASVLSLWHVTWKVL